MKLKLKKIVFLLISLIFLNVSFANAETYDDCILNGLKNVTNDFIAKQIVQSCENKYSKSTSIESKAAVLPKITSIEVGHDTKWKIPVPEGNYVRTAQRIEYGQTVPRVYEIWENIEDGKLKHLMWVSFTKSQNSNKWKESKTCNRRDLHFINKVANNRAGKQECNIVNHWRITGGVKSKYRNHAWARAVEDAKKWHKLNNVPIPNTMIIAQSIFANYNRLEVRVKFNPELEGFPPTVDSNWSSNDWHQDKIIGDKKRQEYIEKVKVFAIEMHKQLKPQFNW
jgi:hypothetical protein